MNSSVVAELGSAETAAVVADAAVTDVDFEALRADTSPYPSAFQAWYAVFAFALAVMINFLDRGILALLVQPIKHDLHLSDVQISLIMGFAFTFFYAILGLPVARLVDRKSRKHIMAIGITIWALMTAVCGFATNFWQLFLARVGLGVGETTSGPSAYSMLSDYFPPAKLPRAIAGMSIGFVAGSGLSMILGAAAIQFIGNRPHVTLPVLGTFFGWQVVLMMVGLPGLVVAAIMLTIKEPKRRGHIVQESQPIGEVFAYIREHWKIFIPLFAGLGLRSVQMFGVQYWGPAFYQRTYGWSAAQVGYISGLSLLIAMPIGLFLGSWFSERYWNRGQHDANVRVVVWSTAISVPISIFAPLLASPWMFAALTLFNTIILGMAAPVENAAVQNMTPNRMRGQMTFLFLFIMNVIGMGFGPWLIAHLSDYVFGEAAIRYSLVTTGAVLGIPAIFVFWYGLKPYGDAMKRGLAR